MPSSRRSLSLSKGSVRPLTLLSRNNSDPLPNKYNVCISEHSVTSLGKPEDLVKLIELWESRMVRKVHTSLSNPSLEMNWQTSLVVHFSLICVDQICGHMLVRGFTYLSLFLLYTFIIITMVFSLRQYS